MKHCFAWAFLLALASSQARAQLLPPTCLVVTGLAGVLVPADNNKTLTTVGSIAGTATITTVGSLQVQALAPASFLLAPSGSNADTTFSTSYRLSGVTNRGDTPGNVPAPLNTGITTISIDLTATKSSGVFFAGLHTAAVTVRCEP
jgi:hypothetical protein